MRMSRSAAVSPPLALPDAPCIVHAIRADPGRARETHQSACRERDWCVSRTHTKGPTERDSRAVFVRIAHARAWAYPPFARGGVRNDGRAAPSSPPCEGGVGGGGFRPARAQL